MKILFIYVANLEDKPYMYLDRKMNPAEFYLPKAGLFYLIGSLRQEFPDFCYKAIDILNPSHRDMPDDQLENWIMTTMSEQELRDEVSGFDPDIVGLSCLAAHVPYLSRIITIIKEVKKDAVLLLGGPYATTSPRKAVLTENIDFIVHGEGEVTIRNLVRALLKGGDFHEIRGIGFLKDGNVVLNPPQPFIEDLDTLPLPAWDLCNFKNYSKVHLYLGSGVQHTDKTNYAAIVSSRGCPYGCVFCHNIFGSKFRARSPQNVVNEMLFLHDNFNVEEFTFSDDVFNFNMGRVEEFCKLLVKKNRPIKFGFITNGLRGDRLSEELIDFLFEAGMRNASIAIESASPRIQKKIKKCLDLKKAGQGIDYMCKKGIYIATYNMLGFQTETKEEINQTLEFNLNSPHHLLIAHTVTPHEGTELYNTVVGEGFVPPTASTDTSVGKFYWKPDEIDNSFREVSSTFLKVMLIRFVAEFYFSEKRLNLNLDIMSLYKDKPFFISGVKTFYKNMWNIYSKAIPTGKKQGINQLLNRLLNF